MKVYCPSGSSLKRSLSLFIVGFIFRAVIEIDVVVTKSDKGNDKG